MTERICPSAFPIGLRNCASNSSLRRALSRSACRNRASSLINASPLLRPHPTTAFAFANCSPPKFPCRTFGKCRPLCPAASTLPKSSQQGGVGFTSTETLTTRKHLTRLYVGSSLALRPIPLSGKTPAHRSPFARLAVLIVCRFLYDIAPSAISSAELCLAYLW